MEILCFFAGTAFVYVDKLYPLLLLALFFYFRPKLSLLGWFLSAVIFSMTHQWLVSDNGMPSQSVIKNATISGVISSIPAISQDKTQFQFNLENLNGQPVKSKLLLNCYNHCQNFQAGQYWVFNAKLKRPRNLGNPGSFDYAGMLAARHVEWTGYVRPKDMHLDGGKSKKNNLLVLRQYLANRLTTMNLDEKSLGILQALSLGITSHIDKDEWELFRRTGTIHLMVISGAHIGLVAGIVYSMFFGIWCRLGQLSLKVPAHKVASGAALFVALIYGLLSGFAVPAERALIVCFFMLIRNFCNQRFTTWQAWRYALLLVIITEPHSVLLSGFYLSFMAVAILVLASERIPYNGFRKVVLLQVACLAGLMPLTLFWFSYGAANGLVANLIAIPWVGFVLVPIVLIITLFSPFIIFSWMSILLKIAISLLLLFLTWVDSFSAINLTQSFTDVITPLIFMGVMIIYIFFPFIELVIVSSFMAVIALFPSHPVPKIGDVDIHLLDVGQGLSVIVQTSSHTLVYDTGAKFFRGGDMGKMALIPYLKYAGVKKLDAVVISHPDSDHRGGLNSLSEKYAINELIVDDPDWYNMGKNCHQYPEWTWDRVKFQFFATDKNLPNKNNHSCVLKISTKSGQVLLTGDIEKIAEEYLVENYGWKLNSTVLLIPHHASKTSSSESFIEHVSPRYAVVSYGFDNPYHFPHSQAINTYNKHGIPVYNTKDCGMINFTLNENKPFTKINCKQSI